MNLFGSHYDHARITRIMDRNPYYARLAAASIARYQDIETRSGRSFFAPVGHLAVTPVAEYLADIQLQAELHQVDASLLNQHDLAQQFPYLQFDQDAPGILERTSAGYVDPQAFIAAQCTLVEHAGGRVLDATVIALDSHTDHMVVQTDSGEQITARKVLIATGAFANHLGVVPRPVDIEIQEHTVVLAQLSESAARDLCDMPAIIYKRGDAVGESVYVLPPIAYPDGHTYVKIGQSTGHKMYDPRAHLQSWFRSDGDKQIASWLIQELTTMIPGVDFSSIHSESCAVTTSVTGRQYIDRFGDAPVYSLLAGNGAVAKSADEVGRIGAHFVIHENVPPEYAAEDFELRYK